MGPASPAWNSIRHGSDGERVTGPVRHRAIENGLSCLNFTRPRSGFCKSSHMR